MESPLAPNPHSRTAAEAAPLRPPSLSSAATPTNPSPALLPSVLLPPPWYEPFLPCLRRPRASPPSSSHAPPRARRQRRAPRGPRAVQPVQSPTVEEESRAKRIQQRRHVRELGLDGESSGVGAAAKARWVGDGGRLAGRSSRSKAAEVIQIWRYLTTLVNVLGLVQQLSLGTCTLVGSSVLRWQKLNAYKNQGPSQWMYDFDDPPRHQDAYIILHKQMRISARSPRRWCLDSWDVSWCPSTEGG